MGPEPVTDQKPGIIYSDSELEAMRELRDILGATLRIEKKIHGVPSDFDWVKAHAECSVSEAFERLKNKIETDTNARNDQRDPQNLYYEFSVITRSTSDFMVNLSGNRVEPHTITFSRTDKSIVVSRGEKLLLETIPILSDKGECRLMIDGDEHTFW
jgi:hypothetical protein